MASEKDYRKAEELLRRLFVACEGDKLSVGALIAFLGLYIAHRRGGITSGRLLDLLNNGPTDSDRETIVTDVARCVRLSRLAISALIALVCLGVALWMALIIYWLA